MKRAVVIALSALGLAGAVAAPARAQVPAEAPTLPLVTSAPGPERAPRYERLQPIPWFYRQIDLQRQNTGLNGRKNALRSEQLRAGPKDADIWEDRPLSDW